MTALTTAPTTREALLTYGAIVFEPHDIVEVRTLPNTRSTWCEARELHIYAERLHAANVNGQNIYIGANPRSGKGKKGDENIPRANCVFTDTDGGITPEQAREQFEAVGMPEPSLVIASGGGIQSYWRLATPCSDLDAWDDLTRDVIVAVGSDPACCNRERLMRAPGFKNLKYDPPPEARIVYADPDLRYDFEHLRGIVPRKTEEERRQREQCEAQALAIHKQKQANRNGSTSVIDTFNEAHDLAAVLESKGYTKGQKGRYIRPGGKSESVSVLDGTACFHSSNDRMFACKPSGNSKCGVGDAFDVYRMYEHDGDFKRAVKAAAEAMGLNEKKKDKQHSNGKATAPASAEPIAAPEEIKSNILDSIPAIPETTDGPGFVLTPGEHITGDGTFTEIGNDTFTDAVIEQLPAGCIYSRGGVAGEIIGADGLRAFREIGVDRMRIVIDGAVRLAKWTRRGEKQCIVFQPCSRDNGGLLLSRASCDSRIPTLSVLTTSPIFLADFTLSRPGFHDGVFYDEPDELKGLAPETDRDVIRRMLADLLTDFPFKGPSDRENYIGLLLTPQIRTAIGGNAPAHLINSPLERTGKTKLAEEVLGGIVLGRRTPAQQLARSDDEMDKRILGTLLAGDTLMHLDNLRDHVDLPSLASLLTATTYQSRLLGGNRIISLPNHLTIVGTGNNVRAEGEIAKRTVPICLQPDTDAPELRTDFKHPDLWGYVLKNRRRVLACLIGMVINWRTAGRPAGSKPMGGFDQWAAVVGGIMTLHGYTNWMTNAAEWRETADPLKGDLGALVEEWTKLKDAPLATIPELLEIAQRLDLFSDVLTGKSAQDRGVQTSFGMRVLGRNLDRPVGDYIIRRNSLARPAVYKLERVKKVDA